MRSMIDYYQDNIDILSKVIEIAHAEDLANLRSIIVDKIISNFNNVNILTANISYDLYDEIRFIFRLCFHDENNNNLPSTDVWFEYASSEDELRLNHGCIGYYGKSNIYELQKISLLNYVFNNIDQIETSFRYLLNKIISFRHSEVYIEFEKYQKLLAEERIKDINNKKQKLESLIEVGCSLIYEDFVPTNKRVVPSGSRIVKVTEKTIKVVNNCTGNPMQLKKAIILDEIANGNLKLGLGD